MAELLVSNGVPGANRLAAELSELLPDDYIVVSEPMVRRKPLDVVIVGPQGLMVVHAKDWRGEIELSRRGAWRENRDDGRVEIHENPSKEAAETSRLVREFLDDHGFSTRMALHQYIVLVHPDAVLVADGTLGATEPPVVERSNLPAVIAALEPTRAGLSDADERMAVAEAVADGYLGVTERVQQPFVFRSSGFLGARRQAWTVRDAVRYMDRNPQDGIHHLRNDTLARWLTDENAPHLASLARDAVRRHPTDPRAALEEFLIGTGLVPRPRLRATPKRANLGYVLAGQSASGELALHRGRGRGYLYGRVEPAEPWLRIEPHDFHRGALQGVVIANTESLLIQPGGYRSSVEVHSSASERPISIPVRVRIMPMPSRFTQGVLRPLIGGAVAGATGLVVGAAATLAGLPAPDAVTLSAFGPAALLFWPLAVGLVWFLLGVIRGANQAPAWPIAYASWRWVARTLFWGAAIGALAVVVLLSGGQMAMETGLAVPEHLRVLVLTLAMGLAAFPATVGEIQSSRAASEEASANLSRYARRPAALMGIGLLLLVLSVGGVRIFGTAQSVYQTSGIAERAETWFAEHWAALDENLGNLMDQLYLRYYDRRAGK